MELKILKESQNPLFNRKEVFVSVDSSKSPSNEEVITALSKKYSVEKNAIRVNAINGKFGSNEFTITANIYPSNEERDNVEKLTKKEKETESKTAEPAEPEKPVETPEPPKTEPIPAVEETGSNPVKEAKKVEEEKAEEDKKEKEKTPEEKQAE